MPTMWAKKRAGRASIAGINFGAVKGVAKALALHRQMQQNPVVRGICLLHSKKQACFGAGMRNSFVYCTLEHLVLLWS